MLGILSVNSFVVHDGLEDGMDLIGWHFYNYVKINLFVLSATQRENLIKSYSLFTEFMVCVNCSDMSRGV